MSNHFKTTNLQTKLYEIKYNSLSAHVKDDTYYIAVTLLQDPPKDWTPITPEEYEASKPDPQSEQMTPDQARQLLDDATRLGVSLDEETEFEAKTVLMEALPIPEERRADISAELESQRRSRNKGT